MQAASVCGLVFLGMTGCTASAPPAAPSVSTEGPGVPESASPGRTTPSLIPTGQTRACAVLDQAELKAALGSVGASLKAPEPSGVRLDDGFEKDTCVYPLDASGVTTNAVVMEVIWDGTGAKSPSISDFGAVTDPEEVSGLGTKAQYSMVRLSGSSEFSLRVQSTQAAYRLVVARPNNDVGWDRKQGRAVLEEIMRKAKI
ncbi:hypothetical protein [Arthrobacter sp. B3I4]|uniref:hypothetical protein n=1 Tax=Arthrobacter sp. B3I4 TaxID=3042267 RepID=UPI0027803EF6|nr:hypothetical protein [Arthrobacter sp. B3I4]MDQ0756858.1 hypothetical protein [Arthrobacter sp. B3I4]